MNIELAKNDITTINWKMWNLDTGIENGGKREKIHWH